MNVYEDAIGKVGKKITKEFAKEIKESAYAIASDPWIIEYLKEEIPGGSSIKRRTVYISGDLLDIVEETIAKYVEF